MPIRKDLRAFYGHEWRTVTRPLILARDGHACKQCGKWNHLIIDTVTAHGRMWWRFAADTAQPEYPNVIEAAPQWFSETGAASSFPASSQPRTVRVVLTCAHLNHRPGDDRPENLAALCQRCHLVYDNQHHRDTRATRKDQHRPILAQLAG